MKWYLCAVLCAGGLTMMEKQARGEEGPVSVQLDPTTVICQKFLGFGVEWDSNGYNGSGINDADFAVISYQFRRFDRAGIGFVVDSNRQNVATLTS